MGADDLSVDELAARSGVTVRTIRFYQSEGLLPPPGRAGREARYGRTHVERLDLIAELQARGLRLQAIADVLGRSGADEAGADWLGLGEALRRPWTDDRPVVLRERELADRLAAAPAGTLDALVRSGVVEPRPGSGSGYVVPSPELLDIFLATMAVGLDPDTGARLRDLLQQRLRAIATELVATFTEEVSRTQLAEQGPGSLAALLDELQPLTRRTVGLLFAHEMERAQQSLLDAALPDPATDEGASAL